MPAVRIVRAENPFVIGNQSKGGPASRFVEESIHKCSIHQMRPECDPGQAGVHNRNASDDRRSSTRFGNLAFEVFERHASDSANSRRT